MPDDTLGRPEIETEPLAGVAVPTTCRDRVDADLLAAAVAALDDHGVSTYAVSPVGGLKIRVGVYRPDEVCASLRQALEDAGGTVTDHGVADGFRRLRVDVTRSDDGGRSRHQES